MKVVNLDQNSPEWLQWREGGIGASDCPIILNHSPFKKAFTLWQEKTRRMPKPQPTWATQHGQISEDTARRQLAHELKLELTPISVMDDEAPYLRASYDGWSSVGELITEIKCPMTIRDHRRAKEGEIPFYYRLQMYQQMHIARVEEMIYYSWYQGDGVQLPVKFDAEYWNGIALPAIQEFWRRVQENEWPLPNGENAYGDSKELRQAAGDWLQAERLRETADYTQRIAEAEFIQAAGENRNFTSNGVQCQQQVWKPLYRVAIDCDSPELQAAVLKACEPLLQREGVRRVRELTYYPKLVYKFFEVPEK